MKFAIHHRWFFCLVMLISAVCVPSLFAAAGLPSPLEGTGNILPRLAIFMTSMWGIAFALGPLLSFTLTKAFPEKFNA